MKGSVHAHWEMRINGQWTGGDGQRCPASIGSTYLTVELPSGRRQRVRHYQALIFGTAALTGLKVRYGFDRDPITKLNTQRITFTDYRPEKA